MCLQVRILVLVPIIFRRRLQMSPAPSRHFMCIFTPVTKSVLTEIYFSKLEPYVSNSSLSQVDMEYISMDNGSQEVQFSVKPQEFLPNGQASDSTLQRAYPSFDLSAVS